MPNGPLLDLRHLQVICAIVEHGRITDAAEAIGLTPSALSHRVKEAERRLDVVLFARLHKRLRITPAAEHLADIAQRILSELDHAEQDVRRMNRGVEHVVRLAVEAYSSYHWLPGFTSFLREKHPGIELQVMAAAGREPVPALTNRNVDLVVISGDEVHLGLHEIPLFEDELLFIMHPDHRHAGKAHIDGPDIVDEDFITYTKTVAPDREFARLFRPAESYPRWTATVELPEAIVELVAAGQGTSVLAGWAVQPAIASGRIISARVSETGILVPWRALTRAEDVSSGPIAKVAEALAQWTGGRGGFA